VTNYFWAGAANAVTTTFPITRSARYVRVQLTSSGIALSLAEVRVLVPGSAIKTYYAAGGQRVAERVLANGTNTLYYLAGDHLGSTSVTTCGSGCGTAGALLARQLYYPFGQVRYITGTAVTDYGFTGQMLDDTGWMYYNARYYDPALARFTSADTIVPGAGNPQAFNRYSYSFNNPVRYTDPTGHFTCDGADNCHEILQNWLDILNSQGGDIGAELARVFLVADNLVVCTDVVCNMFTDQLHISIVSDLGGSSMRANTSANSIEVSLAAWERANEGGDSLLAKVGEFGHEIRHLQQTALFQPSLHSEVDGYEVQYQLYAAFGIEDSDSAEVQSALAVHNQLVGASNYELINSPFATDYYKDAPLYKPLWWMDKPLRAVIKWWHGIWAE